MGRIPPDRIRYLAFEGGGGKGCAYVGALKRLHDAKVIDRALGFAGSSAGAITAFLLSIGMTVSEIARRIDRWCPRHSSSDLTRRSLFEIGTGDGHGCLCV